MTELRVEARSGGYAVVVEPGVVARVGAWVRERAGGSRVMVVCDHNTVAVAGQRVADDAGAAILELEPGERTKSFDALHGLCVTMALWELDRDSIVVAVGGGVVGDLVGTAAAVYLRGIRLVQVPTTLLGMVDSSIGGKVGVNLAAGKNLVGAFKTPEAVFVDPDLLAELPAREFRSGMAEVVKSGLVADAELCELLRERAPEIGAQRGEALVEVVTRTCAIKVGVTSRDETESGERAILNYGHTFAHGLEAASGYPPALTHGEAVSAGMGVAARLGIRAGVTPAQALEVQERLLRAYGLPLLALVPAGAEQVLGAMAHDKKGKAGTVRWVLLDRVGQASWGHQLEPAWVRDEVIKALPSPGDRASFN